MKDGVGHYLDAQGRVDRASHENIISVKKKLAREVTKGKSEVDFLDINEVIGGNIEGETYMP